MPEGTRPSQADIILCVMLTLLMVIVAVIVLNLFGVFPISLPLRDFAGTIIVLVTVVAAILAIPFIHFENIWRKARRFRVILASSFMTSLLVLGIIASFFVYNKHKEDILQATDIAQKKATYVAQFNATATAIAKDAYTVRVKATAQTNATSVARAKATVIAITSKYPFSNTHLFTDRLKDKDVNYNPNQWDIYPDTENFCGFNPLGYLVTELNQSKYKACFAEQISLGNFTYQVQMRITQGDCGGISFRASSLYGNFYYFIVCKNGHFKFGIAQDHSLQPALIDEKSLSISTGENDFNTIGVVARGNSFMVVGLVKTVFDQN